MKNEFISVTEKGGESVTQAQIDRFYQRYIWAGNISKGKEVLEIACGTGPGLGYLNSISKSLIASDIDNDVLEVAKSHYGDSIALKQFEAQHIPYDDDTFDVIIIFEAIYYLPDFNEFCKEAYRTLKKNGVLLIATANKDLFDFNPSPFSVSYYNPPEMNTILTKNAFTCSFLGGFPINKNNLKTKTFRFLKKTAVKLNLVPKTMSGKKLLKRLFFGELVTMPKELKIDDNISYIEPSAISSNEKDQTHLVLYCEAKKL